MTSKIGLISDLHATPAPVQEALSIFQRQGVDQVWCAGDIAGYAEALGQTTDLLIEAGCRAVMGNHDRWWLERNADLQDGRTHRYLAGLPNVLDMPLAGLRVLMVHASPPDSMMDGIRLLDEDGQLLAAQQAFWSERLSGVDCDVLVVGHTHQVFAERLGHALVINPGSTKFNHSCAILSLPALRVEWFALGGQTLVPSWNWGMLGREGHAGSA